MIDHQELKDFMEQMEASLQKKIDDADNKAGEYRATENYRADMQGFSRGLYHAKNEILGALRKHFL